MSAPAPLTRVVVVVPAHNEAQLLPACLEGLRVAAAGVAVEVVVVLDACTDHSADLVPPWARAVVVDRGCVGAARAAGFAAAGVDGSTWCASTDADSVVGPRWLAAQLMLAGGGAQVVVGTVTPSWGRGQEGLAGAFEAGCHRADGHGHVHGASLGIAGATYLALGGFAELPAHEDVDLVARAARAGANICWAGAESGMVVATSARTSARAPRLRRVPARLGRGHAGRYRLTGPGRAYRERRRVAASVSGPPAPGWRGRSSGGWVSRWSTWR